MSFPRRIRRDDGFTLIELMIVVLIIAILVAIAVPTFLGQREATQDRAAQVLLRHALVVERAALTADIAFTDDPAYLSTLEPSFTFAQTLTPPVGIIGVELNGDQIVCLVTQSESGTWFGIWDASFDATAFGTAGTSAALYGGTCPALVPGAPIWAPSAW